MGGNVAFYTYSVYAKNYLINTVGLAKSNTALIFFFSLLFFASIQPLLGYISDKLGRKPLLLFFGISGTFLTIPIFYWLNQASSNWQIFLLICALLIIVSGYSAICAIVKTELFPVEIRALGSGFPYSISVAIFGGTAEYIALWLKKINLADYFFYYVSLCIFISLLFYLFMPETKNKNYYYTNL